MADVQQLTGSNQLRGETQTHRARHFQYRKRSLSLSRSRFRGGGSGRSAASEQSVLGGQQPDN